MRISSVMRGARAAAMATLVFSLSLSPSYARMGGPAGGSFARSSFGHSSHFAPGGLNRRFEAGRFGFNRFGSDRFNRFGFDRFSRFGGNQVFVGGWGGYSAPGGSQPIIVGDSAPMIINIGVDPGPGDAGSGYSGGCVIHKLNYDNTGKYVGERQIPQC
jgi:hypothetical protein